jgi:hypothetical protein
MWNSTPVFSLSAPLYASFGMGGMRASVRFKTSKVLQYNNRAIYKYQITTAATGS